MPEKHIAKNEHLLWALLMEAEHGIHEPELPVLAIEFSAPMDEFSDLDDKLFPICPAPYWKTKR